MNPARENVHAVTRALQVLDAFGAHEQGMSLAELSRRLGMGKPTLLRTARTLARSGYLVQMDDRRWRLGPAAGSLGVRYQASFDANDADRPRAAGAWPAARASPRALRRRRQQPHLRGPGGPAEPHAPSHSRGRNAAARPRRLGPHSLPHSWASRARSSTAFAAVASTCRWESGTAPWRASPFPWSASGGAFSVPSACRGRWTARAGGAAAAPAEAAGGSRADIARRICADTTPRSTRR